MTGIGDALRRAGLGAHAAEKKTVLFDKAARALRDLRGDPAQGPAACYVPGRLEFVGKHTDYAGGRSLVCAIERGICFVATPRRDAAVRVVDADRGSNVTAGFDAEPRSAPGDWSAFVATVVRRLARDFSARTGADVACASDLPRASGMSSSSALVTGIFLVLSHANGLAAT
ncbi:MAG TPA: galactokinase family protein, partial [Vicinamibacterales bacterium]|nr:galactokinase family protein [Vicinamibacterales bacterium]